MSNRLKNLLLGTFLLTLLIGMSGCSTTAAVTGGYWPSKEYDLKDSEEEFVRSTLNLHTGARNSYVIYDAHQSRKRMDHPKALWEVVDGKVKLAGFVPSGSGYMVLDVEPGKHTYIDDSACGLYQVTVDVKRGYSYNIKTVGYGKPSLMSWCKNQSGFHLKEYPNIYMSTSKIYQLDESKRDKINALVDASTIQAEYDAFIKDVDKDSVAYRFISGDEGYPSTLKQSEVIDYYKNKKKK